MITTVKIGHIVQSALDLDHAGELVQDYFGRFAEAESVKVTIRRDSVPVLGSSALRYEWTVQADAQWPIRDEPDPGEGQTP